MGARKKSAAATQDAGRLQLFFEENERALLCFAGVPAAAALVWTVVMLALYPGVPYCSLYRPLSEVCC